ncbi:MAG: hypothetical protein WD208_09290 [Dehalococcoidia bacterium]
MNVNGRHSSNGQEQRAHWHYEVYGQFLCSDVRLPELRGARFKTRDMEFRFGPNDEANGTSPQSVSPVTRHSTNLDCDLLVYDLGSSYLLRWEGKCDFLVTADGRYIECRPGPSVGIRWVQSILYGMMMSYALHLQGVGTLHASAIETPQGACAFLAEPGTGKSTLAARFASRGHRFFTDDVLALDENEGEFTVQPGFPYTSLSAVSMEGLFEPGKAPVPSYLNDDKFRVAVDGTWASFAPEPTRLSSLFIISRAREPGSDLTVKRLSAVEGTLALMENSLCVHFLPGEALRRHFGFAARLAKSVPVWRMQYPGGFDNADIAIDAVLDTIAAPSGGHSNG